MELSIIIPSLRSGWFKKFIRSVHENTKDVEYEILENHEKGVLYDIINEEFKKVKGKYVVLMCDDCVVHEGWARKMIDFMEQQPPLTIGNFTLFESRKNVLRPIHVEYFNRQCSIIPFVRWEEVYFLGWSLMSPGLKRFYGDIDLNMRFFSVGGRIATCPDAVITMFSNRDSIKKAAISDNFKHDDEWFNNKWGNYDFNLRGYKTEAGAL